MRVCTPAAASLNCETTVTRGLYAMQQCYCNNKVKNNNRKLEILAELHRPEAHIWGDRRGQPIRSATGSELES